MLANMHSYYIIPCIAGPLISRSKRIDRTGQCQIITYEFLFGPGAVQTELVHRLSGLGGCKDFLVLSSSSLGFSSLTSFSSPSTSLKSSSFSKANVSVRMSQTFCRNSLGVSSLRLASKASPPSRRGQDMDRIAESKLALVVLVLELLLQELILMLYFCRLLVRLAWNRNYEKSSNPITQFQENSLQN